VLQEFAIGPTISRGVLSFHRESRTPFGANACGIDGAAAMVVGMGRCRSALIGTRLGVGGYRRDDRRRAHTDPG
jgi:hypothetical protein